MGGKSLALQPGVPPRNQTRSSKSCLLLPQCGGRPLHSQAVLGREGGRSRAMGGCKKRGHRACRSLGPLMNCPDCETYNDSNRRYCLQCGKFLIVSCDRCSFANPSRARYCGGCGDRPKASSASSGIDSEARGSRPGESHPQNYVVSPGELDELLGESSASADAELPNKLSQQDLDRLFGTSK